MMIQKKIKKNNENINFDEIYPKKICKKKKTSYREKFSDNNGLRKFHDLLLLNNQKINEIILLIIKLN